MLIVGVDIFGGNGNGQKRRKIHYKGKGESRKRHSPSVLGSCSQPLIQHRAHRLHDLPHHIRVREHLYKEILILLIACGGHVGEVLSKEQHEGLTVIVLGITVPLVLSGIV